MVRNRQRDEDLTKYPNRRVDNHLNSNRNDHNEQTIDVHEERLNVEKERVDVGEVVVNKTTDTRVENVDVDLHQDQVHIERVQLEDTPTLDEYNNTDTGEDLDVIRIPLTEERIRVIKDVVVTEEIIIRKDTVKETQRISEELRREDIEVQEVGLDGKPRR